MNARLVGGKPFKLLSQGGHLFIPEVDDEMKFIFKNGNLEIHDGPDEIMLAEKKEE